MRYTEGQAVAVRVERVLPFGAFVRFEDGERGYIRRREMTLSGDVPASDVVTVGQTVEALIIQPPGQDRMLELSLKQLLPDPWEEIAERMIAGAVIPAIVKGVSADRLLVQVTPGVDGQIPLKELALTDDMHPDDVYWVGDRVEAVVTFFDPGRKRLRLSIARRIKQLLAAEAVFDQIYEIDDASDPEDEKPPVLPADSSDAFPRLHLSLAALVVEDDDDLRDALGDWLIHLGCEVVLAESAEVALAAYQHQTFAVIFADLDMSGIHGLDFIQEIRHSENCPPVVVMSDPLLIEEYIDVLKALEVAAVFSKPLDLFQVHALLTKVSRNEPVDFLWRTLLHFSTDKEQDFEHLGTFMRSAMPIEERFIAGLTYLVHETQAEKGIVFRLDYDEWRVSIVAEVGPLQLYTGGFYALENSPVKDVIVERIKILENACSTQRARFLNLSRLLSFESCIGVPISTQEMPTHALFLFHRSEGAFSHYRMRDAMAMAMLFGVALDSQAMDERLRSAGRLILSGELTSAFSHEVSNRLTGIGLQFGNLHNDVRHLLSRHSTPKALEDFAQIEGQLAEAVRAATDLQNWVREFRRLTSAKAGVGPVDVCAVLQQTQNELATLARRSNVTIRMELPEDSLRVRCDRIALRQVFLNLMLNAIQHMALWQRSPRHLVVRVGHQMHPGNLRRTIDVRIVDTGPGIHQQLWERIFDLGFTTRPDGSGLGLYIARNLLTAMGGSIKVEDSVVPLGTTFLISLPVLAESTA